MAKREYFRRVYRIHGVSATQPFQEDDKAPEGCEIHYQRITVNNDTNNDSDVILQVNDGGSLAPEGTILNVQSEEPKTYNEGEIVIQGTERLRLQWEGSVDGDNLTMTLTGYLWNKPKGR